MKSTPKIKLKKKDKVELEKITKSGSIRVRTLNRARILLLSSGGKTPTQVRESTGVRSLKTIQDIKERYIEGGLELALYDRPRTGAPKKFDGKHRAEITALACTQAPDGHAKWSLQLLADKIVELKIVDEISHTHVGRILKKTKLNRT